MITPFNQKKPCLPLLSEATWRICAGPLHTMVARTGSMILAQSGQIDDGCGGAYLKGELNSEQVEELYSNLVISLQNQGRV
jgi:hypothetical protein